MPKLYNLQRYCYDEESLNKDLVNIIALAGSSGLAFLVYHLFERHKQSEEQYVRWKQNQILGAINTMMSRKCYRSMDSSGKLLDSQDIDAAIYFAKGKIKSPKTESIYSRYKEVITIFELSENPSKYGIVGFDRELLEINNYIRRQSQLTALASSSTRKNPLSGDLRSLVRRYGLLGGFVEHMARKMDGGYATQIENDPFMEIRLNRSPSRASPQYSWPGGTPDEFLPGDG